MAVKRGKLEFQHVIGMKVRCKFEEWAEHAQILRALIVKNDVFATGPVILQWNSDDDEEETDIIIYWPVHQQLNAKDNEQFFYIDNFVIDDGLKIRHTQMENSFKATELLLNVMAEKAELKLKRPFYYIYLPVYQEYIVDIYAEIEEGEGE